jgi:membrane-associated phospholipid phosphatase
MGLTAYAVAYVVWFFTVGIIVDRISVTISVVILMAIVHLGRPLRSWLTLGLDLALYAAMWVAYDETRGVADRVGMPLQVQSVINIDRILFLGAQPNVWMQRHFYSEQIHWYDVAASIVYFSHFVVPVFAIVVLWIWNRGQWVRFMRRIATVLALACIGYVLAPTAPPWMAAGGDEAIPLDALPPLARPAGRGWAHVGFHSFVHAWETGQDWVNRTAAMPSLHGAFALFIVVWIWPYVRRPELRALMLVYPLAMLASLVYLAEHYVIDVVAGWAAVAASFLAWDAIERRLRLRRQPAGDTIPTGAAIMAPSAD